MCDYNIPVFMIRVQKSEVSHDTERFGYYETKEEAETVARKLHGYKISVERMFSNRPFKEMVAACFCRYPNL